MRIIDALEAHRLATPLKDAHKVFLNAPAAEARVELEASSFDQAPVYLKGHTLVGWVATRSLVDGTTVKAAYQPLSQSPFAGASTSINDVLRHLASPGFCFTVGREGIEGFITPSDLDRHASRCHFYILVAGVEMMLSSAVKSLVPERDLVERISTHPMSGGADHPARTLRKMYDEARDDGRDTHAVEYLYLGELIDVAAAAAKFSSTLITQLELVRDLRTTVMHPTRALTRLGANQLASAAAAATASYSALGDIVRE